MRLPDHAPSDDVVIAGAGPAGALAACLLARRGARVTVVDRCRFPRPKLCGDTLNPGALALLGRHFGLDSLRVRGCPIDGMLLTGPGPVEVRGEYGDRVTGLAVTREILDAWLLERAVDAGVTVLQETTVSGVSRGVGGRVNGLLVRDRGGHSRHLPARLTVGADGRRSRVAQHLGVSVVMARPRRWAIGGYFEQVDGLSRLGEMHVRHGHYLGVAPTRDGRANACVVLPRRPGDAPWRDPEAVLADHLTADPLLGPRFRRARRSGPAVVLGPLAVETRAPGAPGALLAGDAVGFVDPMTGDGIHLALKSAEEVAAVIGQVLDGRLGLDESTAAYASALARRVGRKQHADRALRALVGSPRAVMVAAQLAGAWPAAFRAVIRYAGDVHDRDAAGGYGGAW